MKAQDHAAAMVASIGHLDARVSQLAGALRDLIVCETLATETRVLDATGQTFYNVNFTFASVAVTNLSSQKVTVTNMGPRDVAPTSGPGVGLVPAGKGATYNLAGSMLTFYGNPGDTITFSVFARPQPPAWG